jgi:hypothetical protein
MGGAHTTVASWRWRANQLLHPKVLQTGTNTHHIDQSVDSAHFMEMHRLRCAAVHSSLSLCQQLEHIENLGLQSWLKRCLSNLSAQISPMAMGRRWLHELDPQSHTPQPTAGGFRALKAIGISQSQRRQGSIHRRIRKAKVEQGG